MSKQRDHTCRYCRVERTKLFLKGHKCLTDKCPVERKPYPPGEQGRRRRRILGYGIQLREKQKLKRYYGMTEKQFLLFFKRAEKKKGVTGENLLSMLERRLDNVVFITGFAYSRFHARQLITHGHFFVSGNKATIPSMIVDKEDVISFSDKSVKHEELNAIVASNKKKEIPSWLEVNFDEKNCRVLGLPTREEVTIPVEEHLIVELYSKV